MTGDEVRQAAVAFLERQRFAATSFFVALLPEHVKTWPRVEVWVSRPGAVLSGAVETFAAAGLFIAGVIAYVTEFARGPGWEFLASRQTTTIHDWFGVGALGFWSYLFTPQGIFLVYTFGEGILRTFEVLLTGRMPGVAVVSVPWRLVERLRKVSAAARLAHLLGPARPDEVVRPGQSRSGLLEVYTVEDKHWSERQVVELDGEFFILVGTRFVPRGGHHAWRHAFEPLEAREVIRGAIARIGPGAVGVSPSPAGPARG